jgi:hypothetical protein
MMLMIRAHVTATAITAAGSWLLQALQALVQIVLKNRKKFDMSSQLLVFQSYLQRNRF